jgi:tetratricopeptide (TPR) repeat protein
LAWTAAAVVGLGLAGSSVAVHELAGRWSDESGSPPRRLLDARRQARLFPREPAPREQLARALMAQTPPDNAAAVEPLRAAAELAPYNAYYLLWRAELLRALGAWDEAEALALRALALEPDFLQARLLAAEAAARERRLSQARGELELFDASLLRLSPMLPAGHGYVRQLTTYDAARLDALRRALAGPARRPARGTSRGPAR